MEFREHFDITTTALRRWFKAQLLDCLYIGLIWLVGLWIIGVPWAPFWAVLGGLLQFIPNFGPLFALIGPAFAATISGGFMSLIYVFILYAVIAVVDGLVLQPYLMRRTARVPIWASIVTPIFLGMALGTVGFGFVGVLIAAPLLAIFYTYRGRSRRRPRPGEPEILPPQPPLA
ncbi:MAG: AI-2E family transporter [Terriglobales bacterium]